MIYFKIEPGTNNILEVREGNFVKYNTKADSAVNGKPYLVEVTVTDPAHDPATQVKEGPVDAYNGTTATRVYSVRSKTQAELDADQLNSDLATLRSATKDCVIVLTALIDAIIAKGTLTAQDVEPVARQAYQSLKVLADRVK